MKVEAENSREISMKIYMFAWSVVLALFLGLLQVGPATVYAQQNVPEIQFDSVPDFPALPPGMNFGEVSGVAVNSKGHVFVFTRSNSANGPAYGGAAAQLFEFGPKGEFLREIGKASTPGPRPTPCASTRMTTSGPSTRVPTWSSSSIKRAG